jgi:hypothetical protein
MTGYGEIVPQENEEKESRSPSSWGVTDTTSTTLVKASPGAF